MFLNSLSGRFLLMTIAFVMLAEVLIFVPSEARFRQDYLRNRLERSQIAALAVVAAMNDPITPKVEQRLLDSAGVYNIVLRSKRMHELVLSSPVPTEVSATYNLGDMSPWTLMRDALMRLAETGNKPIRVIGPSARQGGGQAIEVTMPSAPLRAAMRDYGLRILMLSALISVITAALIFLAVRLLMVLPIKRVVCSIQDYAEGPEDRRRIIKPTSRIRELRDAEQALRSLQMQLTGALKQKDRLATLGGAVAKISHDLRNILTTATLLADRMERSADPTVKRIAPKLVGSLSRAVNLCESTLSFGRVEEPQPTLSRLALCPIVNDVMEGERLAAGENSTIQFSCDVPAALTIIADGEQLHRVITNLVRNARQALAATGSGGMIMVRAIEDESDWIIEIEDTGPGLPPKAREHLFTAFQGGARKGGTGLGLAIAAELVRGHGGRLELVRSDDAGTVFAICLPKESFVCEVAAAE